MHNFNKLVSFLNSKQRKKAIVLVMLMFVGMILETISIGLVIPALSLMMNTNLAEEFPTLIPLLNYLGNPKPVHLVIGGIIILVFVYALKTIFLVYLSWKQFHFTYGLQQDLSKRLFDGYLRQPFTFYLQRNSAQLIRNTTGEVASFTNAISAVGTVITESLVLLGVIILLIIVQPLGAVLVIGTLGLSSYLVFALIKERILLWGIGRQRHEGFRFQHLQQGFGSIKDLKLLGRQESFIKQYDIHNQGSADVGRNIGFFRALPRFWMEFLAVIGLLILVVSLLAENKSADVIIPTLGLFAAAAFRLIPSTNRIFVGIQQLRFLLPTIDLLRNELDLFSKGQEKTKEVKPFLLKQHIILKHLSYIYPGTKQNVLENINIQIKRGETIGFIGRSGSGKSTLIDIILGLLPITSGEVKVDNININANMRGWQKQIGYVPQTIYLTDDTLRRNIAFGIEEDQIDDFALQESIKAAQLDVFVGNLPEKFNTIVGERGIKLSGGQRQRIGIARALYHNPEVLVLDEATSALDTKTERGVMQSISALQGKKTILIVAHRLSTLVKCDFLYRLDNGKIIQQGTYASLVDSSN